MKQLFLGALVVIACSAHTSLASESPTSTPLTPAQKYAQLLEQANNIRVEIMKIHNSYLSAMMRLEEGDCTPTERAEEEEALDAHDTRLNVLINKRSLVRNNLRMLNQQFPEDCPLPDDFSASDEE